MKNHKQRKARLLVLRWRQNHRGRWMHPRLGRRTFTMIEACDLSNIKIRDTVALHPMTPAESKAALIRQAQRDRTARKGYRLRDGSRFVKVK